MHRNHHVQGGDERQASTLVRNHHGHVTSSLRFVASDALRAMALPTSLEATSTTHVLRNPQQRGGTTSRPVRRRNGDDSMVADVASLSKALGSGRSDVAALQNNLSSSRANESKPTAARSTSPYDVPAARRSGANADVRREHSVDNLNVLADSGSPTSIRLRIQLNQLWDDVNASSTAAMRDAIGLHLEALRSLECSSGATDSDAVAADIRLHLFYIEEHISLLTEERKLVTAIREKMMYRSRIMVQIKACAVKYRTTVTQHILLVRQQQQQGRYGGVSSMFLGANSSGVASGFTAPRHVGPSASVIMSGILHEVHRLLDVYRQATVDVAELHAQWRRWITSGNFFGCASREGSSEKWERAADRPRSEAGGLPPRGKKHRAMLLSRGKELMLWHGSVPLLVVMCRDLFQRVFEGEPLHVLLGLHMDWNPLALPGRRWSVIGAAAAASDAPRQPTNRSIQRAAEPARGRPQLTRDVAARQPALVSLFSRFAKDHRWRALMVPATADEDAASINRHEYLAFFARQHRRINNNNNNGTNHSAQHRHGAGGGPSPYAAQQHLSVSDYYAHVGTSTAGAPSTLFRFAEGKAHRSGANGGGAPVASSDTERLYERCALAFGMLRAALEMHSVVRIQSVVRGTQCRSTLWEQLSSVVVLQRVVRGHLGRLRAAQARRDAARRHFLCSYWQARCPSVAVAPQTPLTQLDAQCLDIARVVVSRWLLHVALRQRGRRQRHALRIVLLQRVGRRMLLVRQLRRHRLTLRRIRNGLGLVATHEESQRNSYLGAEVGAREILSMLRNEGCQRLGIVHEALRAATSAYDGAVCAVQLTAATATLSHREAIARCAVVDTEEPAARTVIGGLAVQSLAMAVLLTQAAQVRDAMLHESVGAMAQLHAHFRSTVLFPQHYYRRLDDAYVAQTLVVWDAEEACREDIHRQHRSALDAQLAVLEGRMAADVSEKAVVAALHTPERIAQAPPHIAIDRVVASHEAAAPTRPGPVATPTTIEANGTATPIAMVTPQRLSPSCTPRRAVTPSDPHERLGSPSLNFLCQVFPTVAGGAEAPSLAVMACVAHEEAIDASASASPSLPLGLDTTIGNVSTSSNHALPSPGAVVGQGAAAPVALGAVPPPPDVEPVRYTDLGPVPPPTPVPPRLFADLGPVPPPTAVPPRSYTDLGPVPPPAPPRASTAATATVVGPTPSVPVAAPTHSVPQAMPTRTATPTSDDAVVQQAIAALYDRLPPFALNALRVQAERLQAVGRGWVARRTVNICQRAARAHCAVAQAEACAWLTNVVEPWCRLTVQSRMRMGDGHDDAGQQRNVMVLRASPEAPLLALHNACNTFLSIMRVRALDATKKRHRQVRVLASIGVLLPWLRQQRQQRQRAKFVGAAPHNVPPRCDDALIEIDCIATSLVTALLREEADTWRWLASTFAASLHPAAHQPRAAAAQSPLVDLNAAASSTPSVAAAAAAAVTTLLQRVGRQYLVLQRCMACRRRTTLEEALMRLEMVQRWSHVVMPHRRGLEAIAEQHVDCLQRSLLSRGVATLQRASCYLAATVVRSGMCRWVRCSWASVHVQRLLRWQQSARLRQRLLDQARQQQARIEESRKRPALAAIVRNWRRLVTRRRVARERAAEMQAMRDQHAASVISHAVLRWIASCSDATRNRRRIAACHAMVEGSPSHNAAVSAAVVRLQCMFRAAAAKRKAQAMRDAEALQQHQQRQERATRLIQTMWRRAIEARRVLAANAQGVSEAEVAEVAPPTTTAMVTHDPVAAVGPSGVVSVGAPTDVARTSSVDNSADVSGGGTMPEPIHVVTAADRPSVQGLLLFPAPLRTTSVDGGDDSSDAAGLPVAGRSTNAGGTAATSSQQTQVPPLQAGAAGMLRGALRDASPNASMVTTPQIDGSKRGHALVVGKLRTWVRPPSTLLLSGLPSPAPQDASSAANENNSTWRVNSSDVTRTGPTDAAPVPNLRPASSSSSSVILGRMRQSHHPPPSDEADARGQHQQHHPLPVEPSWSDGAPSLPLTAVQPDEDDLFHMLTAPQGGAAAAPQANKSQRAPPLQTGTTTGTNPRRSSAAPGNLSAQGNIKVPQPHREASSESLPSPPSSPPRAVHVAPPQPLPERVDDDDGGGGLDWDAVVGHTRSAPQPQQMDNAAIGTSASNVNATTTITAAPQAHARDRSLDSFREWGRDSPTTPLDRIDTDTKQKGNAPTPPSPPELDESLPDNVRGRFEQDGAVSTKPMEGRVVAATHRGAGRPPGIVSGALRPGALQPRPYPTPAAHRVAASAPYHMDEDRNRADFNTLRRVGPTALVGAMMQRAAANNNRTSASTRLTNNPIQWQQDNDVQPSGRFTKPTNAPNTHRAGDASWSTMQRTTRYDPFQPTALLPGAQPLLTTGGLRHDDTASLPDVDGPQADVETASLGEVSANSSIGSLPCEVIAVVAETAEGGAMPSPSSYVYGTYAASSGSRRAAAAADVHYAVPRSLTTTNAVPLRHAMNPLSTMHHAYAAPPTEELASLDDDATLPARALPWAPASEQQQQQQYGAAPAVDARTFSPSQYLSTSLPAETMSDTEVAVHYGSPFSSRQPPSSSWTSERHEDQPLGLLLGGTPSAIKTISVAGSPPAAFDKATQRPTSAGTPASALRSGSLLRTSPLGATPRLRMPDITIDPPSSPRPTPQRRIRPDPNRSPRGAGKSPAAMSPSRGDQHLHVHDHGNLQKHTLYLSPLRRPLDMLQSAERNRRVLQDHLLASREAAPAGGFSLPSSQMPNYLTLREGFGGDASGRRLYNDFD